MKRLTKKQMIIFAIGQLGWSTLSGVITTWLVTFYLPTGGDIVGGATKYIIPGLVIGGFMTVLGLISALGRVFDAVTDPLIASLSDRSKNPRGRRNPFMQLAALPLAIVTVLVFCPLWGEGEGMNIVWVSIMLVLFYLFMTMYCTPYNSLISEYGKTQEDRMFISTSISLTFFVGTLLAYVPFILGGANTHQIMDANNKPILDAAGNPTYAYDGPKAVMGALMNGGMDQQSAYAWSFRICFIVLAVIALVAMLLPAFLIKERDYVDTKPSEVNVFKSLGATFKNRDFRVFVGSDVMYWVGLTMFQTGLPFFVKVSMGLDAGTVLYFLGGMTVLSAAFYPIVTKLVMKFGKKKLVIFGFFGLAAAYAIAACTYFVQGAGGALGWVLGIAIVVIAAFPMALLGIIPQSIVADVAEAEGVITGENREGMFFAARTFAMKFGQSLALILFTSLAILGTTQNTEANDIVPSFLGLLVVALVAIAFCVTGALILMFYREKFIMKTIAKEGDEKFMAAVEANNKKEEK